MVGGEISPGGAAGEGAGGGIGGLGFEFGEPIVDGAEVGGEGIGAGVGEEMEAGAVLGDAFEMLAPEIVLMEFFGFGGEGEAALGVEEALGFEDVFVLAETEAEIEVAAFEEALDVVGILFGLAEVVGDEVVLVGDEEAGDAGVALTAGAAAELIVDAAGFVAADAEDAEAAPFGDAGAEDDIDAAAGHVGGERDAAELAGLGDDGRFFGFVFRVEEAVGEGEDLREMLGLFDGAGGNEDGLAGGVDGGDFGE